MKLYCVRHGEAQAPNRYQERSLTPEGTCDVHNVSDYLKARGFQVARVLHSQKLRAQQTAQILADALSGGCLNESDLLNPEASVAQLVDRIRFWNDDTMLVGHMPHISALVSFLVVGCMEKNLVLFSPGTMVCLEQQMHYDWVISWIIRPELLKQYPLMNL